LGGRASTPCCGGAQSRVSERVQHWEAGTALERLIHAATELILDGRHTRLRICGNCTWLFLDLSRNGSRRWCSMEGCGTQVKVRRLTERRRVDSRGRRSH
jgi:predicted RNA-binding Zn ribbon-like protein